MRGSESAEDQGQDKAGFPKGVPGHGGRPPSPHPRPPEICNPIHKPTTNTSEPPPPPLPRPPTHPPSLPPSLPIFAQGRPPLLHRPLCSSKAFADVYRRNLKIMMQPMAREEALLAKAERWFTQVIAVEWGWSPDQLSKRMLDIALEVSLTGTYSHTTQELEYGARVAWRNAAKCVGRVLWGSLVVCNAPSALCVPQKNGDRLQAPISRVPTAVLHRGFSATARAQRGHIAQQ